MGYREFIEENVRLVILKSLATEVDYALNEHILLAALEAFGHHKTRDYLRNQLRWLENEVGAVSLKEAGSVLVATITSAGLDHVARRTALEGVQRPSPES